MHKTPTASHAQVRLCLPHQFTESLIEIAENVLSGKVFHVTSKLLRLKNQLRKKKTLTNKSDLQQI